MEWLELLKILSDQQTDAVTQQQIDALRDGLQAARLENLIIGICLLAFIAGIVVAVYLLNRACERRIETLQNAFIRHRRNLARTISKIDSMNLEKSDVAG